MAEFQRFPQLPQELQDMVWLHALDEHEKPPRIIQLREVDGGREFISSRQHAGVPIPAVLHACPSSRYITQKKFDAVHREFWPAGDPRRVSDYRVTRNDILYIGTANKSFWHLLLNTPLKPYHQYSHTEAIQQDPICRKCNVAIDSEMLLADQSLYNIFQITHHLNDQGLKLYIVMALKANASQGLLRLTSKLRERDSLYWNRDLPPTNVGLNAQNQFEAYIRDVLDNNFGLPERADWDDRGLKNRIRAFVNNQSTEGVRNSSDVQIVKAAGDIVGHGTYERVFTWFFRQRWQPRSSMELALARTHGI